MTATRCSGVGAVSFMTSVMKDESTARRFRNDSTMAWSTSTSSVGYETIEISVSGIASRSSPLTECTNSRQSCSWRSVRGSPWLSESRTSDPSLDPDVPT